MSVDVQNRPQTDIDLHVAISRFEVQNTEKEIERSGALMSRLINTNEDMWSAISRDDEDFNENLHAFFDCMGHMCLYMFKNMEWSSRTERDELCSAFLNSQGIFMNWYNADDITGYDTALRHYRV
jgi:hypothetical protein